MCSMCLSEFKKYDILLLRVLSPEGNLRADGGRFALHVGGRLFPSDRNR